MRSNISQREARRLKKRVAELETAESARKQRWSSGYPGGVNIVTYTFDKDFHRGVMEGAQMLGHALVAKLDGATLKIYAVK